MNQKTQSISPVQSIALQELEHLRELRNRRLDKLERLKLKIEAFQQEHENNSETILHKIYPLCKTISSDFKLLVDNADQISMDRKIRKDEKREITQMVATLEAWFVKLGIEGIVAHFDDFDKHHYKRKKTRHTIPLQSQVESPKLAEPDQKDLRKLYLSLAKQIHPDLASNEQEAMQMHHLMQQLNAAYSKKDAAAMHLLANDLKMNQADLMTDASDSECVAQEMEIIQSELQFIEKQILIAEKELKDLGRSAAGKSVKANRRDAEMGADLGTFATQLQAYSKAVLIACLSLKDTMYTKSFPLSTLDEVIQALRLGISQ